MKNSVVVVVVTFNRKKLLFKCVKSLLKSKGNYIKKILIIDNNSTDGTYEYLNSCKLFDNTLIDYKLLKKNIGGAGGFHYGIKYALDFKSDWIWVMDDDAEVYCNTLHNLLINQDVYYSGLAGLQIGIDKLPQFSHRGFFDQNQPYPLPIKEEAINNYQEIDYSSFVGLLINSLAVLKIGLPRKDFFIWFDDLEYCMRLKNFGPIMYVPTSKILHKDNQTSLKAKLFFNKKIISVPSGMHWKFILGFRNFIFINRIYFKKSFFWFIFMLFKKIVKVILFDEYNLIIIFYYFHAWLQAVGLVKFNNNLLRK